MVRCPKCGYRWEPKVKEPKRCPRCGKWLERRKKAPPHGTRHGKIVSKGADSRKRLIASTTVIGAIILALVLASPVAGVRVIITTYSDNYTAQPVIFTISVIVEDTELLPIDNLALIISTTGFTKSSVFSVDGTPIANCDNLTITPLPVEPGYYGYGYGTGYGWQDYGYGYGYGYDVNVGYGYQFGYGYGYGYQQVYPTQLRYEVRWWFENDRAPDGGYSAILNVNCSGGGTVHSYLGSTSFNIDTTPPTVTITSPADGAVFTTATVTVTAEATDATSGVASATITGVGVAITPGLTVSFSRSVTLAEGANTITATATDAVGLTGSHSITVTYTPPPPPPEKATLKVVTTPVKGEVLVDGFSWGIAPQTRSLDAGTYTVSFGDVSGYLTPLPQTVTLVAGETRTVTGVYIVLAPAEFELSDLVIEPREVRPGENVGISVRVRNIGDLVGTYTVTLKIDNFVEATEDVTLAGGETETVTFTVSRDVEGTHDVEVDGLTGSFTVVAPPGPPWAIVIVLLLVAMVIAAAIFYVRRIR